MGGMRNTRHLTSRFSAPKAKGQVTFMVVFVQKNTSVHGLCVVFMGIREGSDLLLSQAACFPSDAGQKLGNSN